MSKYFLIILCFCSISNFAQEWEEELSQKINGIITSSQGCYLITNKGYIQIRETDPYTEYYRQIYNDTTLVNPNLELKSSLDLNVIPFLNPSVKQKKIKFDTPLNLGLFIQITDFNHPTLSTFGTKFIDSLLISD